jgi:hypothetical protein
MLALALASSRTLSFESPDEAHILVGVLGNGDSLSFHHVGDVGEFGFPEALEDSSVGVGVKNGGRCSLLARHSVLVGSIGSAWGHFKHVVPLRRQLTKAGHMEGQDRGGLAGGSSTDSPLVLQPVLLQTLQTQQPSCKGPAKQLLMAPTNSTMAQPHSSSKALTPARPWVQCHTRPTLRAVCLQEQTGGHPGHPHSPGIHLCPVQHY